MTPEAMYAAVLRHPGNEWPWLPICVATLYLFTALSSSLDSQAVCVSGFCV